ncbi:MAG TPA: PEGA domain-containing protein [Armatimonadota bacterium]|nr:PEGA domain-containing protein [Armatimonadota bacterium]
MKSTGSGRTYWVAIAVLLATSMLPAWSLESGALFVTSKPSGQDLFVNGKLVGKTPLTLENLTPGKYRVEVRSDQYLDASQDSIEVKAQELASVAFELKPARGSLLLRSDLVGAAITLDGEAAGTVSADTPFERQDLAIGRHVVTLSGPWLRVTREFGVTKGEPAIVDIAAKQHAGTIEITSDLPIQWGQLSGRPIEGTAPFHLTNIQPGEHEIILGLTPVPYRDMVTVRAGETTTVSLRGGEHLGTILISADLTAENVSVRVDDVLVSDSTPSRVQGVIAGSHIVEVRAVRQPDKVKVVGQRVVFVPPGGTALAAFKTTDLLTDRPKCPDGMVWVPQRSNAPGEYAFSQPHDEGTPNTVVRDPAWRPDGIDPYGRRAAVIVDAGGTVLKLDKAASVVATHLSRSSEAKRVNQGSPLLFGTGSGTSAGGPGMMGGGMTPEGGPASGGMQGAPAGVMQGPGAGSSAPPAAMRGSGPGMMGGGPGMMGPGMMGGGAAGGGGGPGFITAYDAEGKRKSNPLDDTFTDYVLQWDAVSGMNFCIDKYEYPNFPGATPVAATLEQARSLCAAKGKRLCSATEWVAACSGPASWLFPYGNQYDPSKCNTADNPRGGGIAKSGAFPECVSSFGAYDMSGNLAEWVEADVVFNITSGPDAYREMLTQHRLLYDTSHWGSGVTTRPGSVDFDTRGGSWLSSGPDAACGAFALRDETNTVSATVTGGGARGFRCCTFADFDPEIENMVSPRMREF